MVDTVQEQKSIVKLPPKRFRPRDLGTDRSRAYNKVHNTEIANNHMLDRYLTNKEQLEKTGRRK